MRPDQRADGHADRARPEAADPVEPPAACRGDIRFDDVHFALPGDGRAEALAGVDLRMRPGRDGRPGRRDRRGQVDDREAGRPLLRRRPAGAVLRRRRSTVRSLDLAPTAASSASCRRSRSCSPARSATTSPTAGPTRPTPRSRPRPGPSAPTTSIAGLPGGYRHVVTERGRSLSAGQRQLIALARAQLVDPAILLLDEATSNLDLASEARVQRAMGVLAEGRTTLLVAHRLPTARAADRIARHRRRAASSRRAPTTSWSASAAATPRCGRRSRRTRPRDRPRRPGRTPITRVR